MIITLIYYFTKKLSDLIKMKTLYILLQEKKVNDTFNLFETHY